MPKRKRDDVNEQQEIPASAILYERWDTDALESISELVLNPQIEILLARVSLDFVTSSSHTTRRLVSYRPAEFQEGRVYGQGFQGLKGWIRRFCSYKYYHDIDIENCAPALLSQILEKKLGSCPEFIQRYAKDRAGVFDQLRANEAALENSSDKILKYAFLLGMHGGSHANHFEELGLTKNSNPIPLLVEWEKTIRTAAKKLMEHPDYKRHAKALKKRKDKKNKIGTFTSWLWQMEENKIILALKDYFQEKEQLTVGGLVFDGVMIERKKPHPSLLDEDGAVLRRAEAFIENNLDFKIRLVEKPLTPKQEDWDLFWGEKALHKIKSTHNKQLYLLRMAGQLAKLKRMEYWTMKPHLNIPGVFSRHQEHTEFINQTLRNYQLYREASMKKLQEWFCTIDHPTFELLSLSKMNRNIISFRNCYFDLSDMKVNNWEDLEGPPPLTDHFFDIELEMSEKMDKPTPLWDSLLKTQLGPSAWECEELEYPSMFDMLEILIGRLFYPIGKYDNWQVHLFLKGDANTGKSTVLDIIKHMFPPSSTGVVTATQEKNFGLESIYQKRIVMIPDMPKKLSKLIHQSDFQSMATGEGISIARKNKAAVSDQLWQAPLVLAGNPMPDYTDNSGSISRRLAMFLFTVLVQNKDTTLKTKIIDNELVTVLLRCLVKYRNIAEEKKGQEFWAHVAPQGLIDAQSQVKEETNFLANFLKNGDDYYQILHKEGHVTTLNNLNKAFSNHMKFKHKIEKATIGTDYYPIKAAGFTIRRDNLCKTCHFPASKETCGAHYNPNNRYRRFVVVDMQLKTHSDPSLQQNTWLMSDQS